MDQKKKIALFITATGQYIQFVSRLLKSAEQYFLPDHEKTYFVFTDHEGPIQAAENIDYIFIVPTAHKEWPLSTMGRPEAYFNYLSYHLYTTLNGFSHCYAIDADAYFVSECGDEILSERVGVQHCAFVNKKGTFENNVQSASFVDPDASSVYYGGGFYGGKKGTFYIMNSHVTRIINDDIQAGITPKFHDESALNAYFAKYPPTLTLSPSFHWPEWGKEDILNPYIEQRWNEESEFIKARYGHDPPFKPVIKLIDKCKNDPNGHELIRR